MIDRTVGRLTSSPVITRYSNNPILSSRDIPYADGLVYNGSAIKYRGRYVMLVRVDHASLTEKTLGGVSDIALAHSDDGISWDVQAQPCIAWRDDEIVSPTDPRLMLVDGLPFLSVAVQTRHGMETSLLRTEDFARFECVSTMVPDNRDVVLFPEKIGGMYLRIERPFPTFGHGKRSVFDMWISESPDLVYWGKPSVLLDVERVPYANQRIGAGTPPLRTPHGWLMLFHAVDDDPSRGQNGWEETWTNRYSAGVLLLDLENPRKVLGFSRSPLLAPEAAYEVSGGYRNNIVFPCGWVLEDDGELKIYYGAADTVPCLATARLGDLIALCAPM